MASFCTNCGSPLNEGQVFCSKCGAKSGAPQPPSAAAAAPPPPAAPVQAAPMQSAPVQTAPPPPAAPVAAAPAAAGGGSSFIKILLVVVGVIFLFGAIGVAGVAYVGYRVRQKAREMGLTGEHRRHSAALSGGGSVNGCKFLSKEEVSAAVGMTIVRAEPGSGSEISCSYSVMGDVNELTMKHAMQLNKSMAKEMSKEDQDRMEAMGKSVLQQSSGGNAGASAHAGEVVVLVLGIDENAAQFQMKLNKGVLSRMGPMATVDVPNVGDEAFAAAGSMLFVRKNDTLARFTYTQCPCGNDEIVPLAQKVANAL
jgi:zinc-ribbon domain